MLPDQAAAYYAGMLAYYWVLATPTVGFIFGAYLYLSVNWFHVHYDEAFSSLQIPHHKGFSRLHITPGGELHIWGLAMDKVGLFFLHATWLLHAMRTLSMLASVVLHRPQEMVNAAGHVLCVNGL